MKVMLLNPKSLSWLHKILPGESYKEMNLWVCSNKKLALLQQNIHCQDFTHFTVLIWEKKKQFQNSLNMKATVVEEATISQTKTNNKDLPPTGTDMWKIPAWKLYICY